MNETVGVGPVWGFLTVLHMDFMYELATVTTPKQGCRRYPEGAGQKQEDAWERSQGEEDHNQHWQEDVSSNQSNLQIWYESQIGEEGASMNMFSLVLFLV